jgi:hypothetical protein
MKVALGDLLAAENPLVLQNLPPQQPMTRHVRPAVSLVGVGPSVGQAAKIRRLAVSYMGVALVIPPMLSFYGAATRELTASLRITSAARPARYL